MQAVERVIKSGWITQGPEVAAFEKEFAQYTGAPYACAVSSCTAALHLSLLAVGVQAGDEVITATHSFIATANAIRYCGAKPVFVDINPNTFNMNVEQVAQAITPGKTRAILCVHQMGLPCDLINMVRLSEKFSIPLVEDAACAIGSEVFFNGKREKIGKPHGKIACFSFHPRKILTTGDGGMITTSDPDIDHKIRLMRQHGMSVNDLKRHQSNRVVFESYSVFGFNYRMTDLQAAIGREQLKRLPDFIDHRIRMAQRYHQLLRDIPNLRLPCEPEGIFGNWQSYCVRLTGSVSQKSVMQYMLEHGVATRRGIMCSHREQAYPRETWACLAGSGCSSDCDHLQESERAQDQCVILPLSFSMTEEEQDRVATLLGEALTT